MTEKLILVDNLYLNEWCSKIKSIGTVKRVKRYTRHQMLLHIQCSRFEWFKLRFHEKLRKDITGLYIKED